MPSDDEVVETAADAAEDVIFSRLSHADIADLDVTVTFEEGVLDVDVYLDAPGADDVEQLVEDAALAARAAVDELFESS